MTDEGHYSRNGFLTSRGLREVAQREGNRHGVDIMGMVGYLDKVGSVSGPELERDLYADISDIRIDEQARRFHNGY